MIDEKAFHLINDAKNFEDLEEYKKSFKIYITVFKKYPRMRKYVELNFRQLLVKLVEWIHTNNGNLREVMVIFTRAARAYRGNVHILKQIAQFLLEHSYYFQAICYYQKALMIDSSHVEVEKCLNWLKQTVFPRSFLRVYNDSRGNEAYISAIRESLILDDETVIDAGSPAVFAATCVNLFFLKKSRKFGYTKGMCEFTKSIMFNTKINEISLLNTSVTELCQSNISQRISLFIFNNFDSGLLGANVLQTLKYAWETLLRCDAKVLPCYAEFYVMGAKCDRLNFKYQLSTESKKLLNIPDLLVHTSTFANESYYGEDLNLYNEIEYVSKPNLVFNIKFNDYCDVLKKLTRTVPYMVDLTVKQSGEMNVMVGWFNLYLRENIMITTDPRAPYRTKAWPQAVFYDFIPKQVENNEDVRVKFLTFEGKLALLPEIQKYITRLSNPTIKFLNDTVFTNAIVDCVRPATAYLGQLAEVSYLEILDLCPFPLFGLIMMKRGAHSLACHARTCHDKQFIEKVFKINGIPLRRVTVLMAELWNHYVCKKQIYHSIFSYGLSANGDIDVSINQVVYHLKLANLVSNGLFLPANVSLIGQLVESERLADNYLLNNKNLCGFNVANLLNRFRVTQAYCLDVATLEYKALSEPIVLSKNCLRMRAEVIKVPVTQDGECNAILCWHKIRLMDFDESVPTDRSNSFIDNLAFLIHPSVSVHRGDVASVIGSVDPDGSYKLLFELDLF